MIEMHNQQMLPTPLRSEADLQRSTSREGYGIDRFGI